MDSYRRIDVGSFELRVGELGHGSPTFLCLHGLVDSLEIWSRLAPALAERGRVVAIDQRAHGEADSPPGPYEREDLADDAIRVLDDLGVESAILIGHSMGGIMSMTAALRHPTRVRGLVLLGTASQCTERVAEWYERIAEAGETDGLDGLAHVIYGKDSKRKIRGNAAGIAHVTRTLKSLFTDPLTPKLAGLRIPALLVVGEKDPMGPKASEIIRDHLSGSLLHILPGLGHWTHLEAPEKLIESLDHWLPQTQP